MLSHKTKKVPAPVGPSYRGGHFHSCQFIRKIFPDPLSCILYHIILSISFTFFFKDLRNRILIFHFPPLEYKLFESFLTIFSARNSDLERIRDSKAMRKERREGGRKEVNVGVPYLQLV